MVWKSTYNNNSIRVEHSWFEGEKLYVNGRLQDRRIGGLGSARLNGYLADERGERRRLRVSLRRKLFGISCEIFVDNKLVDEFPNDNAKRTGGRTRGV